MKDWEKQALAMREASSIDELVERYGEPHHKETLPDMEIWHYPLGAGGGTLYSVHVSVFPDRTFQAYLHMQPERP